MTSESELVPSSMFKDRPGQLEKDPDWGRLARGLFNPLKTFAAEAIARSVEEN